MYEELVEAINVRRSVRGFLDKQIDENAQNALNKVIDEVNEKDVFSFKLVLNSPKAFSSFRKSYGMFDNVNNYIAIIAHNDDDETFEKIGFYGEKVVLEATKLGLGTCWVYSSFDRDVVNSNLDDNGQLIGVIPLGYHESEYSKGDKKIYKILGSRNIKPAEYFYKSDSDVPQWFLDGVIAASKAPTGKNARPIIFKYMGGKVTAVIDKKAYTPATDLGITKFHFLVGAGGGRWEWGNEGQYLRD